MTPDRPAAVPDDVERAVAEVEDKWRHVGMMGGFHTPSQQRATIVSTELRAAITAALTEREADVKFLVEQNRVQSSLASTCDDELARIRERAERLRQSLEIAISFLGDPNMMRHFPLTDGDLADNLTRTPGAENE